MFPKKFVDFRVPPRKSHPSFSQVPVLFSKSGFKGDFTRNSSVASNRPPKAGLINNSKPTRFARKLNRIIFNLSRWLENNFRLYRGVTLNKI